jgi:hypothetical protein
MGGEGKEEEEEVKTSSGLRPITRAFFVRSLKLWNYITRSQKYVELGVVMNREACLSLVDS